MIRLIALILLCACSARSEEPQRAVKALLISGGGHHDYETQKDIITKGMMQDLAFTNTVIFWLILCR